MYLPPAFAETRVEVLHETMAAIAAAAVVSQGPDGLVATHVPIELRPEPAPWGTVCCHFARPNPHGQAIAAGGEVLLIFQGPQGYVSPGWYPTKKQTGKVVPTWNYVAIHAYGRARTFSDLAWFRRHLAALTDRQESRYALPWRIDDAPAEFVDGLTKAIVGVEIELSRIEGKWKASQNRPEADRMGVVAGLTAQGDDNSLALARLVEAARGPRG
jgi:transcriptional regulator